MIPAALLVNDWRSKGVYYPDFLRVSPAAPVVKTVAKSKRLFSDICTPVSTPIPDINLGTETVIISTLFQSPEDPRFNGFYRAAERAKPICVVFKIDSRLIVWTPQPIPPIPGIHAKYAFGGCPDEVAHAIASGATILCHNQAADQSIYKKLGWSEPKAWNNISAVLAAANYPHDATKASQFLLGLALDKEDDRFLRTLDASGTARLSPADLSTAIRICLRRVQLTAITAAVLGQTTGIDEAVRLLDHKINSDGVRVDLPLVQACLDLERPFKNEINNQAQQIIDGLPGKPKTVKAALAALGITLSDGKVQTIRRALSSSDNVQTQVILIALLTGKQSLSKYQRITDSTSCDGFLRGLYCYQQARTGRWSSEGVQAHNLKKTALNPEQIKRLVDAVKTRNVEEVFACFLHDIPLTLLPESLSGLIRAVFIPREGHRFFIADYKAIEVRVLLWLARDYQMLGLLDACDLYVEMAKVIFGKFTKDHPDSHFRRAVGKIAILGCGYGMGKDRFVDYCRNFGIDLAAKGVDPGKIVQAYRKIFVRVEQLWYALQETVLEVIESRQPATCGRVAFSIVDKDLQAKLPSGRVMIYHNARVETGKYSNKVLGYSNYKNGYAEEEAIWGGTICENICQAVARDVLAEAMVRVNAAGYFTPLHTHDEVVAEVPTEKLPTARPAIIVALEQPPAWAPELPLKVEAFESDRYGEESIL